MSDQPYAPGDRVRILNHRLPEYIGEIGEIIAINPRGLVIRIKSTVPFSGGSDAWELREEFVAREIQE